MSNIEPRRRMKLLAVLEGQKQIIEAEVERAKNPYMWPALCVKIAMLKQTLNGIVNTKAELFRTDKPELDKRRVKRSMKGAVILSPFKKSSCESVNLNIIPQAGFYRSSASEASVELKGNKQYTKVITIGPVSGDENETN